jgi:predicted DNA-binding transcriptional regulator YafY
MATNKNALIRYKILDKCFRNPGKRYFIEDLIEECETVLLDINTKSNGISRRQIFEDISFMESEEGWNIELLKIRDGKRVYYRYQDISYSINNMPLNESDLNYLNEAISIFSQFKGLPQFDWVSDLKKKVKSVQKSNDEQIAFIEFDNNEYLKGIEFLSTLYDAILYKKVLTIKYKPFENEKPETLIIHPYYLKQYNNRWFLFGYNPQYKKSDWNLALDRIVSIKEKKEKYFQNDQINWKEYFDEIIGVTKPDNSTTEQITLHFLGKTGHYIQTKPIHESQKSKWIEKDIFQVKLEVICNYEFERMLLSYADQVKIIEPSSLKQRIKKRLKNAYQLQN